MSEERFVDQGDGRMVAGPGVDQPDVSRASRRPIALFAMIWLACMASAFMAGTLLAPVPPLSEQLGNRLIEGCRTEHVAQAATEADRQALVNATQEVEQRLREAGRQNVESTIMDVPPGSAAKRLVPGAEVLGVVTWEECR